MGQLVAVSKPTQKPQLHVNQTVSGTKDLSIPGEEYLEGELLVENRIEGLPVDLGLELLLFVGQQVDLYVGVRRAAHVHGRQLCSLDDPHDELMEEGEAERRESQTSSWKKKHISVEVGQSFSLHLTLEMTPFSMTHFRLPLALWRNSKATLAEHGRRKGHGVSEER